MKVAYFLTHPIQYQSPLIKDLVARGFDIEVVYATDITARAYQDKGFGASVQWDVPLLDSYRYHILDTHSAIPVGMKGLTKYRNQIFRVLSQVNPDVVWVHGWGNAFSLAALTAAKRLHKQILIRGETNLQSFVFNKPWWKQAMSRLFIGRLLQSVSGCLAIGSANRRFYQQMGVSEEKVFDAPYVVDNKRFQQMCHQCHSAMGELRNQLGISPERPIVLYCAKLIEVKDPETLIRAVGRVSSCDPVLVVVGNGHLKPALIELANQVAPNRVLFEGFQNQSQLPAYYSLCDLFVLPSRFEPWGLVVNEVMNAAKPVLASEAVGATKDLIDRGVNGDLFSVGDVDRLTQLLDDWLLDRPRLEDAGAVSLQRINRWDFSRVADGLSVALSTLKVM